MANARSHRLAAWAILMLFKAYDLTSPDTYELSVIYGESFSLDCGEGQPLPAGAFAEWFFYVNETWLTLPEQDPSESKTCFVQLSNVCGYHADANRYLRIDHVTSWNEGLYMCRVATDSQSFLVTMQEIEQWSSIHKRSATTTNMILEQGGHFQLNCGSFNLNTSPRVNLVWSFNPDSTMQQTTNIVTLKKSEGSYLSESKTSSYVDRATVSHTDGSLTINDVTLKDSGTYVCLYRQPTYFDESWDVLVYAPPTNPIIDVLSSPIIEDYEEDFVCMVVTATRDTISLHWELEGRQLEGTIEQRDQHDGSVTLRNTLRTRLDRSSNRKLLRCHLRSFEQFPRIEAQSVEQTLNVTYTYNTYVYPRSDTVKKGQQFRLQCVPRSDANPGNIFEYRWQLNGSQFQFIDAAEHSEVLAVDMAAIRMAGEYSCLIRNEAGWTRQEEANTATISVRVPPAAPEIFEVTEKTSSMIAVQWDAYFYDDPRNYTYILYYKRMGESTFERYTRSHYSRRGYMYSLNMTGLSARTVYYLELQAHTHTPTEGHQYSDGVSLTVQTPAVPKIILTDMTFSKSDVNISWQYINPASSDDVRLRLMVTNGNRTVLERVVEASNENLVVSFVADDSVQYGLQAEVLEGSSMVTRLPVLKLGEESDKGGSKVIIAVVISLVVLLILIVLIVLYCKCRRKQEHKEEDRKYASMTSRMQHLGTYYNQSPRKPVPPSQKPAPPPRKRSPIEEDSFDEYDQPAENVENGEPVVYSQPDVLPSSDRNANHKVVRPSEKDHLYYNTTDAQPSENDPHYYNTTDALVEGPPLMYAELDLDSPDGKTKSKVRRKDPRTAYASIDKNKSGKTRLPSESYEDVDLQHDPRTSFV